MDSLKTVKKFPSATGLIKQLLSLVMKTRNQKRRRQRENSVAPEGCFWVCVGAERQRFVIKTEYANHPLFKMLLDDAESEYGFDYIEGPIKLPCDVNLFYKVLAEMEAGIYGDGDGEEEGAGGFRYGMCSPFTTPTRSRRCRNKVYVGSYELLTPSRLLKINHF